MEDRLDMRSPLVSIIIPTYNRAAYLGRAIHSVQEQSLSDLELIVVDDHSSDSTAEIVAALCAGDARLRWIQHPANRGAQAARNTGIKAARGEWIAFLDSDDEWFPSSLGTRLKEAQAQQVDVIYSECYIEQPGQQGRKLYCIPAFSGLVYHKLLRAQAPMFQSLLVRAPALKEIGFLDESIISYQEWDTSIRLAKLYKFGFVKEPTFVYYRRKDGTISGSPLRKAAGYEQVVQKHIQEIRKVLGSKVVAHHYLRIAVYYQRAKRYNRMLKYSFLAVYNYLSSGL
jgi:glycosyltransferase involved in cell wall biosynthesis